MPPETPADRQKRIAQERELDLLKQIGEESDKYNQREIEVLKKKLELLGEIKNQTDKTRLIEETKLSQLEAQQKAALDLLATYEEGTPLYEKTLEKFKEIVDRLKEQKKTVDGINKAEEARNENAQNLKSLNEDINGLITNQVEQLGFATKNSNQYARILNNLGKTLSAPGGLKNTVKSIAEGIKGAASNFNLAAVGGTIISSTIEYSDALIAAEKNLIRFGISNKEAQQITRSLSKEFIASGASLEDFNQTIMSLRESAPALNKILGQDVKESITQLSRAGLDGQNSIDFLNDRIIKLGLSTPKAKSQLGTLIKISEQLGEPVGKAAKEFKQFGDRLNDYGPNAIKVFKELKEISTSTGVEMNKLLSIAERFDTFEGSAEAVYGLNQVLGTNLNAVQLSMMSDEERIKTIQEAISSTGKSFDDLTGAQRRYLKEKTGFSDFNDLIGLTNETQKITVDVTADNTDAVTTLANEAQKGMSATEAANAKLAASFKGLGEDLAETSKGMAETINGLNETFFIGGMVIAGVIGTIAGGLSTIGIAGAAAGAGGTAAAPGIAALGAAATAGSVGLGALALAIAATGLAITGVLWGISKIIEGIAELAKQAGLAAEPMTGLFESAKGFTFDNVAGFARFATNMTEIATALSDMERETLDSFRKTLELSFSINQNTAPATNQQKVTNLTIPVTLDGRELGRVVTKIIDDSLAYV